MTRDEALKLLGERQRAYQTAFGVGNGGKAVLDDLMIFCRGRESCLIPGDHDRTYALLGRNEVWHRIRDFIDLSPDALLAKYFRPAEGAISHDDPNSVSE